MSYSQQNDIYDVERIVGVRLSDDILEYEIKWLGYIQRTWEPVANLDCSRLGRMYHNMVQEPETPLEIREVNAIHVNGRMYKARLPNTGTRFIQYRIIFTNSRNQSGRFYITYGSSMTLWGNYRIDHQRQNTVYIWWYEEEERFSLDRSANL